MSTTFAIITKSGEKPIARRVGGRNGAEMWFTDELAEMLPNETPVIPLDNSAQGIYTIGDIKNHILNQNLNNINETTNMRNKKRIQRFKKNLREAPIDYGDRPERMDPSIQRKIESGEFPGAGSEAFPSVDPSGIPSKFEELVASERFKSVVDKVKTYTGLRNVTPQSFMQLQQMMMAATQRILQLESQHKEELEELAVKIVREEMAIPEDALQFDAKIVGMGQIDMSGMQGQSQEQQMDSEEEAMEEFEDFDLEKQKRRFLNQLIQGASKKGHYMFHLVEDELNNIDPNLINLYGVMMSINDLVYWIMPDQTTMMMAQSGSSMAGKEEVDPDTDPPTVIARGITFPVLVHELVKGVMEVLATQGLPDDPNKAQRVMDSEDTLVAEVWDLRLGPVIWEKFRESYPHELLQDDKREIQNYLFSEFASMDAKDMFRLAKKILSGGEEGKEELERMVNDIIAQLNEESYEDEYYDDEGDTMYDDNGDVLGTLDLPKNDGGKEYNIDDILDKIGRSGMSSLSKGELEFLRNQSKS